MKQNIYTNNWYTSLKKSPINPPNWVFGTVWPILYLLMLISFFIVWKNKKCYPYCNILTYFIIQFILNLSWTTVFFKFKKIKQALILTIIIFSITLYVCIQFYKYNKIATYLLIPYLLWLCLAMYLNAYIIINN